MADIVYSRTFQHVDWIDNEDVVQAGGEKGFNQKFHDLEAELDRISAVVSAIKGALSSVQELADGAVTTSKIADNQVTASKLAPNAVTTEKLALNSVGANQIQNGAINNAKLQPNAVTAANLQPGSVNRDKIAFQQVNTGSATVGPNGGVVIQPVQQNVNNTKAIVYLAMMTITGTSGTGFSEVEPAIVYRQNANTNLVDVFIRLTNRGSAQAGVIWVVNTFAA